jgi:putative transposase
VYYLPRPVSPADLALMRRIDELHLEHPFMGARMLRDQLARQGIHAGRRHIRTLMLRMDIEALAPQPGTSQAAPGHKVAITLEAIHAKEVIEQALAKYGTPEIVNTDQGSQFTAEEFTDVVLKARCKLSMDGRGSWRDNVFVERLWRSVKYERVYLKAYDSVSQARTDIADYLAWYNSHRGHSSLDRLTPDEAYFAGLPKLKLAA